MAAPLWLVDLIKKTLPQRYTLAKLTQHPVLGRLIDRLLFEGDDLIVLPRDSVIAVDTPIEDQGSMVLPSQVVTHYIEKANYHWIMDGCICREAGVCKDYPTDLGCLFLGETAMGINPALGRSVTREDALEHVERCREAGLVHLIGRNRLDTVWLNVRPGERLLTICNCCPCCCLWSILPHLDARIGDRITKMPGVSVRVTDGCVGCGTCAEGVCFTDAIRMEGGRASIGHLCRGCGRCVDVCPNEAIELTVDSDRSVEDSIERLASLVDVT